MRPDRARRGITLRDQRCDRADAVVVRFIALA